MKTPLKILLALAAVLGATGFDPDHVVAQSATEAQSAAKEMALSDDQRADISRIEAYLNSLTTVSAKFQQYSASDGLLTGSFYLRRPGRLRVEYDPPSAVLLVADGLALSYYDRELNNLEQAPLNLSPLWFLLREKVNLGADVMITSFARDAGNILVGMVQRDEPEAGQVVLEFGDKPLELRQWVLIDAAGGSVRVGLYDTQFGQPLANELFATPRKERRDEK